MTLSIFYSWQGDTSSKTNLAFIESALEEAIKRFHREGLGEVEMAERPNLALDRDTKGVPGQPPIFDTIIRKIEGCGIFVPDLTFIATTEKGRAIPNPNVLIEYGYALRAVGRTRIIASMNDAYGDPSQLPFDMRHARHPIRYTLAEDANRETYAQAMDGLVEEFVKAIRDVLKSGSLKDLVPEKEAFQATQQTINASTFLQPDDIAAVITKQRGGSTRHVFSRTRNLFLRVLPRKPVEPLSEAEAQSLVKKGRLSSFCEQEGDFYYGRNKLGSVAARVLDTEIVAFTQLFFNRELWGIDGITLEKCRQVGHSGEDFGYLPSAYLEESAFTPSLKGYLAFARDCLHLEPPLRFIAGATEIEGYRMAIGGSEFSESEVLHPSITYEGEVLSYADDPQELLLPFYNKLWNAVDLERPNSL